MHFFAIRTLESYQAGKSEEPEPAPITFVVPIGDRRGVPQFAPMTPAKSATATQESNRGEMNKPDKLTAERQEANSDQYTKLDTNKDSKLTLAEFGATPNGGKDF